MEKETVLLILEESKRRECSEKEICIEMGINPKNLYHYKKKYNIEISSRGKNPNSKKKRDFNVNDSFFKEITILSSYWAGFIAADGNISKDMKILSIGLSSKDKTHLEKFLNDLQSDYKICDFLANGKYETSSISIVSPDICNDLKINFNITPKKSLTLVPPNLEDDSLIDAFIVGYIDGDGSIGVYDTNTQKYLTISLLGTLEMCDWIKCRFSKLYKQNIGTIFHIKEHSENTYSCKISDKSAREIFKHYYAIDVPKLNRKWKLEYLEHCINYTKVRKPHSKYVEILKLKNKGLSQSDIAKLLNVTQSNISWYYKQPLFIKMEKELRETKQLDKGEVDIESEN